MESDSLFYRFFKELPSCFFRLVGRPEDDADRYELNAIEYKQTSVRLDGLFLPRRPEIDPAYIWEVQQYKSDTFYANLWTKIGRFLEHGHSNQEWIAVVIYASRSKEQKNLQPYRSLINSDQLVRIYLDELPPAPTGNFELGLLEMIASKPEGALEKARTLVPLVKASKRSQQFQVMVIQFIETVIVHQFPQWSRKEIEKMVQVTDFRQTRVYQEALEEGLEKGRREVALKLIDKGMPTDEIADTTGLTPAQIRYLKKKQRTTKR